MAAWQLTKALWKSDVNGFERFEVTQPMFHAAASGPVEDYLDVCADQDIAVCPYSPLAGGFLTGKYERDGDIPAGSRADLVDYFEDYYMSEEGWEVLDEVRGVADELDATPAQVALRWLVQQRDFTCTPIVGARTVEQLEENVGAARHRTLGGPVRPHRGRELKRRFQPGVSVGGGTYFTLVPAFVMDERDETRASAGGRLPLLVYSNAVGGKRVTVRGRRVETGLFLRRPRRIRPRWYRWHRSSRNGRSFGGRSSWSEVPVTEASEVHSVPVWKNARSLTVWRRFTY